MSNVQRKRPSGFSLAIRKYFLSAFVAFTFVAYAIHERPENGAVANVVAHVVISPSKQATSVALPSATPMTGTASGGSNPPTDPAQINVIVPTDLPTAEPPSAIPPTDVPPTIAVASSQYKDGTYQGDVTDAYYGNVQVQAMISNGQITDVQFLDYPHDRRTSQRINQVATPYLRTEAIQAQSANVDLVSGATLTSQAFIQSLQSALNKARG